MVPGSRFRVPGSGSRFTFLAVIVFLAACASGPEAQSPQPKAQSPLAFDSARAYEHLRQIVSIGPRPAGSPGIARTREYIIEQLTTLGIPVAQQAFVAKTPIGEIPMVNLIATIPGARKERIAITGHYDTKLFREVRFVGANDGGSSAAFLLELARVLKARTNAFTIELIFFDGEEATLRDWGGTDHTYGSQHSVDNARKAGTLSTLKALVLVDMIADRSQRFMRESHSTPWLTDIIWTTAQKLGHACAEKRDVVVLDRRARIDEDGAVAAADIIDLDYAPWHTAADTLDQTSARSLQVVGDVVVASLAPIEARLSR